MSRSLIWLVVGVAVGASGCDNKPSTDAAQSDAGVATDKYVTADPKLERALQAAASASAASSGGPPPSGVFAPGEADRRHSKGAPTAVELVSDGAEPRVSLGPGSLSKVYGPALLEMQMEMGPRSALPTVDLAIMLAPAKGQDGGAQALDAEIKKAAPAKDQPGELSSSAMQEIAAVAGSRVLADISADGRSAAFDLLLSKDAHTDLFAQNAAESLMLATVPLPEKPVGVGASWIAESRTQWAGVDVITYRAFRIKNVTANRITLSLDVNGYAANRDTEIQGVPKGTPLEQFEARAQGELEIAPGEPIARRAEVAQRLAMVFGTGAEDKANAPGASPENNALTEQRQGQTSFVRGDERGGFRRRSEPAEPQ